MKAQVIKLHYHQKSKIMDVYFEDDSMYGLSAEFLRVFSPSAQAKSQSTPVAHKKDIAIDGVVPIGNYAVRLIFSDNHQSGLYSWDYLQEIAQNQQTLWQQYLEKLEHANANRDTQIPIQFKP
ncbi:gamma-butyrobetaine hydroxylase-like domain-containing protein [Algicola sagamiensis]|uniref:gamma-butyrobetaine hydroxylase-like domain-containing protein n=1 Tax=Algicola sagamiensis TaxID=163869 RepID=UPI0003A47499|nr:gamma-butyrobetaine hydroxylase-like domain-containing protein [Algicola sagamiensis]